MSTADSYHFGSGRGPTIDHTSIRSHAMRTEVWAIGLEQPAAVVARLGPHLDADEVRAATARRAPGARDRYVVAHGALREILAALTATTPAAVTLRPPLPPLRRPRARETGVGGRAGTVVQLVALGVGRTRRGGAGSARRCRRRGDPRPAPPREARGPGADARRVPGLARGPACFPHDCLPAQLDRQGGVPQGDRCRARASAADVPVSPDGWSVLALAAGRDVVASIAVDGALEAPPVVATWDPERGITLDAAW